MSLNEWSLLYFAVYSIFMFTMFFSLFTTLTVARMILVIVSWIANVSVTLFYGIFTSQIGFIFLAGVEVLMVMLIFIQLGRSQNDNSES